MSQGTACEHRPRRDHVVVTVRCGNYSAFNGYHFTQSDYSRVQCRTCGQIWRTNAKWVGDCRDGNLR